MGVIRGGAVVASVLFVLVGAGVGIWVQEDVQRCHEQYDDDPTIVAECEDSLTDFVRGLSVLGVTGGIVGLVSVLYRYSS